MQSTTKEKAKVKPYTIKELSALYQVSDKTIKRWIKPFADELGKREGLYYNLKQVQLLFEKLGHPNHS